MKIQLSKMLGNLLDKLDLSLFSEYSAVRFPNFEGILGFSVPSIILADLLGNFVYLHELKRSWFVIRDWLISICFVCFAFQVSLLCDRPVSGNNRLVKFASQIFLIFLILVTCKNKATSASFVILGSQESFSGKPGEHVTL